MYEKIAEAANRLKGIAHKTPVHTSKLLNELTENQMFLKCENFQRMGAFKFRGAYNAISSLPAASQNKGVIAYSSGNHAMATALTCKILGIPATVVMPDDAPQVKTAAVKDYGATIIRYNRKTESREAKAQDLIDEFGYTLIPPFDAEPIIAGQGTVAKELIEEVGELDYLLVPCGGGGLISGCSIAAKQLSSQCKVIGVEPVVSNDATKSFKAGELQTIEAPNSIADGLNTPSLGKITFSFIQKHVDDFITVSEEEIKAAMYFLWTRLKLVVEPSGAVALAAYQKLSVKNKRVGVVLSGGNVDVRKAGNLFKDITD